MPCEVYKRLEQDKEIRFQTRLFWHASNRGIHGNPSKAKLKANQNDAQTALNEVTEQMSLHYRTCEVCKAQREAVPKSNLRLGVPD